MTSTMKRCLIALGLLVVIATGVYGWRLYNDNAMDERVEYWLARCNEYHQNIGKFLLKDGEPWPDEYTKLRLRIGFYCANTAYIMAAEERGEGDTVSRFKELVDQQQQNLQTEIDRLRTKQE